MGWGQPDEPKPSAARYTAGMRAGAPPQTWSIHVPGRPTTINHVYGTLHHMARARLVDSLRRDAGFLLMAARIPRPFPGRVQVTSCVVLPDRRWLPDVAAELPVAKAAIDALVDVGAIPNDTSEYVRRLTFLPPEVDDGSAVAARLFPPFTRITFQKAED